MIAGAKELKILEMFEKNKSVSSQYVTLENLISQ